MKYKNRIKNLEKKYSQTNVSKGEHLNKSTISKINKEYYKNQQKRRVDAILNNVKNKDSIKEEVHEIVKYNTLKELCYNCKEETIIAAIILYVQHNRNRKYRIELTGLWANYNLTWRKYSVIIERLLMNERRDRKRVRCDRFVDNEDFIWWGNR